MHKFLRWSGIVSRQVCSGFFVFLRVVYCCGVFMKELDLIEVKEVSGAYSPIDVVEKIIEIITDLLR